MITSVGGIDNVVVLCTLVTHSQLHDDTLFSNQGSYSNFRGTVILDALAIERNHILARALVTGGPTERVLPPQALPTVSQHLMCSV